MTALTLSSSRVYLHLVLAAVLLVLCEILGTASADAQAFNVIYTFTGSPDGAQPVQSNLLPVGGTFYGTASAGGAYSYCTIFRVTLGGEETTLHSFSGGADGALPDASLIRDNMGNLFGTAAEGGDLGCSVNGSVGCGVIYKLTPSGSFSVVYTFEGGSDGADPEGLVRDSAGNLYGTTAFGGASSCGGECGVIFKIDTAGHQTILYSFTLEAGGYTPYGPLKMDSVGNLYGTTQQGGTDCVGCGLIFKLDTVNHEQVLYAFTGGADGTFPNAALDVDAQGNVYGTAEAGGDLSCVGSVFSAGCGVVFKITTAGKEKVLHTFTGLDGSYPSYGLTHDPAGNLYGTTWLGGTENVGTVFALSPSGQQKVLYSFTGGFDGSGPFSGLIFDSRGNLYGNTASGGDLSCSVFGGCGTVFRVTP